jgi:16S rRNA G966 N2-methylase RsmD
MKGTLIMFAENNGKLQIRPAAGESVRIAIAGDVCPHKDAEDYLLAGNADKLLAGIKPALDDADLRIVQWETVISDTSRFMEYVDNQYDLVFADPPYDNYSPEMVRGISKIIAEGGIFVLSHPDKMPELIDLKLLKSHKYANAHISVYLKG